MAPAAFCPPGGDTVCVMDAGGDAGYSIARGLLRQGYTVHAATQADTARSAARWAGLSQDESRRLKLFRCDLLDYHSIHDALKGCSGLFYAFEPPVDQPNYDEYMVEMEVMAAHNVLEACAQTDTMYKVVFTSSVTAVIWRENRKAAGAEMDERNWSEPGLCRKFKLWHALAKTMAEKTAWALAMDRGVNMVSINAGLLTGPSDLSITNPYLKGAAEMYEDGVFVTVDAKFLAEAHICVYEDTSAYGRYLCFNGLVGCHDDAVRLAKTIAPAVPCPPPTCDDSIIRQRIHSKKLNNLMLEFHRGLDMDEPPISAVH